VQGGLWETPKSAMMMSWMVSGLWWAPSASSVAMLGQLKPVRLSENVAD